MLKTLVVEDDFASRELLLAMLAPYGVVNIVVNGLEAIEAFEKAWALNEPYDLICLDIMLPEMDGYQVLKEVRRIEQQKFLEGLRRAKIIMVTALNDPRLIERAYAEGCEAYLVKPITKEGLLGNIKQMGLF